jgi:hypothetical protein
MDICTAFTHAFEDYRQWRVQLLAVLSATVPNRLVRPVVEAQKWKDSEPNFGEGIDNYSLLNFSF